MSRVITDDDLLTWEVYASGGKYGLPERPKIIFNCLSDPHRRGRSVLFEEGDNSAAAAAVQRLPDDRLREMLRAAEELY